MFSVWHFCICQSIIITFYYYSDVSRWKTSVNSKGLQMYSSWMALTGVNPYWQIMENSSRNFPKIFIFWVVTQAVLLENSSSFFSKFQFWGVTQAVLLENSSIKNHEYLFSFFQFWGVTQTVLLENSSIQIFDRNHIWYVTFGQVDQLSWWVITIWKWFDWNQIIGISYQE